ncbi:MAG: hypothetical protein V3U74_00650 [Thermodesulfobacteriota bacterium]
MEIKNPFEPVVILIKEKIDSLGLSERDRKAIIWGGVGATIFLLIFISQAFYSHTRKLEKRYNATKTQLQTILTLSEEYIESKDRVERIANSIVSPKSLLSSVEKILIQSRVDRASFSIKSKSPTKWDLYDEISVEVKIEKIPLPRIIDILYRVQNTVAYLKISNFKAETRFDKPNLMNISFRVSTFKFNQVI